MLLISGQNRVEKDKTAVIVGGGTAGLICAVILVRNSIKTDLYDRNDSAGRKFILAGMSGLNLTNMEDPDIFASRYSPGKELFENLIKKYPPRKFVSFLRELGIETFTGSSGKVFPVSMGGEEPLERILDYLGKSPLFSFHAGHCLSEIDADNNLVFETASDERGKTKKKTDTFKVIVTADYVVFALGGGSRKNTGSDGRWIQAFNRKGVKTVPFEPSNCGFEAAWSDSFKGFLENSVPLKNISLRCGISTTRNEILLTARGIEGSGVYFLSREIRDKFKSSEKQNKKCIVEIDILPDLSDEKIRKKLEKPAGKNSLSNYLRKTLSINKVKFRLIRELLSKDEFSSITENPERLKHLSIEISGIRPLEEAISSAGGVALEELDTNMMLKKIPGFFIAGEMAGWDAPTGGYLMQGCFSTASAAADAILDSSFI